MVEFCWNITTKCNQNCKYCYRFLNVPDLSFEDKRKVLDKIIKSGVKDITWSGGEALSVPEIGDLLQVAHENGIKNKLITNASFIGKLRSVIPFLSYVAVSVDAVSPEINRAIGRGEEHFKEVAEVVNCLKQYQISIKVNTVLCKQNLKEIFRLAFFLEESGITNWRIFKFAPLREAAILNKKDFSISKKRYDLVISELRKQFKNIKIETRESNDLENLYLLLKPNGEICLTKGGKDITLGSMLDDKIETDDIIRNFIR